MPLPKLAIYSITAPSAVVLKSASVTRTQREGLNLGLNLALHVYKSTDAECLRADRDAHRSLSALKLEVLALTTTLEITLEGLSTAKQEEARTCLLQLRRHCEALFLDAIVPEALEARSLLVIENEIEVAKKKVISSILTALTQGLGRHGSSSDVNGGLVSRKRGRGNASFLESSVEPPLSRLK